MPSIEICGIPGPGIGTWDSPVRGFLTGAFVGPRLTQGDENRVEESLVGNYT